MQLTLVGFNALVAVCYLCAAIVGALMAGFSPGLPTVWPAAGVALALLVRTERPCWPGVAIGAFVAYLHLWPDYSSVAAVSSVVLAAAATAQAVIGATLTRRYVAASVPLANDGEVCRFLLLGGPLACLGPSLLIAVMPATHLPINVFGAAATWFGWWAGNTLGVLLFAPIIMALSPGRRAFGRRWGLRVAVPLLLVASLLAAGNIALDRLEQNEAQIAATRVKEHVHDTGFVGLPEAIATLRSVERLFAASGEVTRQEFAVFTEATLRWPGLLAVEWLPRVTRAERAQFEATARALGLTDYRIRERDATGALVEAAVREEYYPGYFTEPPTAAPSNVGFDFGARPVRRAAMHQAARAGRETAAEPVRLIESRRLGIPVFVPVYAAGFDVAGATERARQTALRGYVQGLFDVERMFAPLAAGAEASNLLFRISDVTPGQRARPLLATLAPELRADWTRDLEFAGRRLRLELLSSRPYWLSGTSLPARTYQAFAVVVAFLIGVATLGAAGRIAATAAQVAARTAELRASEQDLDITLNSIGDAVLTTDTEARVTRMNPVAEHLTGWRLPEARGRPIDEVFTIIHEQTRQPATSPVASVLASGTIQSLANHTVLIGRDGSERAIADSAAPICDPHGGLRGVVLVFRDVQEERAAAHALAASERRYRAFIERTPFAVMVQCGGKFAFLNRKAIELLGAESEQQVLGRPVLEFLHPDSRAAVRDRIRDLEAARTVAPAFVEKWLRFDGSVFHCEVNAVPYVHEGSAGSLVVLQDISERKLATQERDLFFELCIDILCIIDMSGRFVNVNPAFSALLSWNHDECKSLAYQDLAHPHDLADVLRKHEWLKAGGGPFTGYEYRMRCKDGSYRWLSWSISFHENRLYAAASDMTERRRIIAELTAARAAAEQASLAKSAFLAAMSHEIRTPMNGVLGMLDVLTYSNLSEHQADLVTTIRSSATTLLRVIDDILDFSKIEAGRLELERAPVAIADLFESLCNSLLAVAVRRGVEVALFVAPEIPERVLSDDVRLRQIAYNLIGNAIKFSAGEPGRPGRVKVRVGVAGSAPMQLRFSVADNGIGMTPETVDALFDAFTQAEVSTTRRFGGSGLGLAICKRLVDMMNGSIVVSSVLGEGSTFDVTLPLEVPAEQPPRALPDLSNLDCILMESAGLEVDDLRIYIEHAGANALIVADLRAAVVATNAIAAPVVVIQDVRRERPLLDALNATFGMRRNVRHLLITRGRRRRGRIEADNAVTLDGDALRRQAFLRAVAVAAGRASPEVFHEPADDRTISAGTQPSSIEVARACGRLILVAEDDDINQKVIRQQLALLGYAAEIAGDGKEALALWRHGGHGLILTDLHMPRMDGYELASSIRRQEAGQRRIPIIALTANALQGEEWRALEAGVDAYLTKPAPLPVLRDTLERWLAHSPETTGGSLQESAPALVRTLDVTVLKGLVGNDEEIVLEFLRDYRRALAGLVKETRAAATAGNRHQIASLAHKLKSASRSVGAMQLGDACAALERAGRAGDDSALAPLLAAFDQLVETLETELALMLGGGLHE